MKKFCKIFGVALLVILVLLAIAISRTIGWRPFFGPKSRPLKTRKFESTPQRLERGNYIFNSIAACGDCHSQHDPTNHAVLPNTLGSGQIMPLVGGPGRIVAPNITSDPATGAGTWTDDQLARAIREGIGHDGRALFPMMPYIHYRHMADEDLASVIVYVRSLPPIHHELPKTELGFPVKYLIRSVPEPVAGLVAYPSFEDRQSWGAYIVNLAACTDCHTPSYRGQPLANLQFSGGHVFTLPWSTVASANITPDASGIGYYDEALFLEVMRTGYVKARKLDTLMPSDVYRGMTDDDLKAVFLYLRSLTPVKHRVDNTEPATYCKLCREKHGAGDKN